MGVIKADIIVCGGGTAGLPAALAAARAGASVCVVEEDTRLVGATTDQYIQMFCGRPYQGILLELKEKMRSFAPTVRDNTFRHSSALLAYQEFFRGLPVTFYTRQHIGKVHRDGAAIVAVETDTDRFEGKVFIDATGDGDVAVLSGCPFRFGREAAAEFDESFAPAASDGKIQRCTLMYTVKRLSDAESADSHGLVLLDEDEGLVWGPSVVCEDTTDPVQLAKAQEEAFAMMPAEVERWRARGFFISSVAPKIGVRESRRVEGLYMLSFHDIADERTHPDGVCVVNYNIDPWDPDGNPMHDNRLKSTHMPDYEIPYRCMVNDKVDNLIVAGRCISATHVAQSSLRVMGIVIPLGQAAGNAAYLAVRDGKLARDIDVEVLRDMQRRGGVKVSLSE